MKIVTEAISGKNTSLILIDVIMQNIASNRNLKYLVHKLLLRELPSPATSYGPALRGYRC